MNQDDELNEMFREGLTEPGHHAEYREADWEALEKMLDERGKKRGIIVLLPYIGAVAAVLLVFFAWMFFRPAANDAQNKPSVVVNKAPANTTINGTTEQTSTQGGQQTAANSGSGTQGSTQRVVNQTKADNNTQPPSAQSNLPNASQMIAGNRVIITVNKHPRKGNNNTNRIVPTNQNEPDAMIAATQPQTAVSQNEVEKNQSVKANSREVIAANKSDQNNASTAFSDQTFVINKPQTVKGEASADSVTKATTTPQIARQTPKTVVKTTAASRGTHFALTVLAAPDMNGVGSFAETQTGANFGLLFSVGRGRFTLSTGAMYAKAPYNTDFSNYHTGYNFYTKPQYVSADCRILDIPLDLSYRLFGNYKNQFSVGAGLSSYLMLKENYFYDYADPSTPGPRGYEVSNRNKHYFGVADLNVLYQHRLSSKFSLDLQPYVQLPLTNIGYGKVKLQSAGVAVGFSWNIK